MLFRRLLSLTQGILALRPFGASSRCSRLLLQSGAAALVLAGASTQAHAYARAWQPETALPARAIAAPSPHQEIVQVTPSRTREICPPLRECASTLGVTGYQKDSATGLYYAQARWYDPLLGSFNAMDPANGNPNTPVSFHRYLYGNGNPLIFVDRDGRCAEPITFTLCVAALSGVIGYAVSVIHEELTTGADFETAATNPRNIGNGAAVAAIVASGGTLGLPATAVLAGSGATINVAQQVAVGGRAIDEVDTGEAFRAAGLTAGAGAVLGPALVSSNVLLAGTARTGVVGLSALGAKEGAQNVGAGVANGNAAQVLLGVGEISLSAAGGSSAFNGGGGRLSLDILRARLATAREQALQGKAGTVVEGDGGTATIKFEPQGITDPPASFAEGKRMVARLRQGNPGMSIEKADEIVSGLLKTGANRPTMLGIEPGESLFKVVPQGQPVGGRSPFFMDAATAERVRSGEENIADVLGLPKASEAPIYDFYRVTPKPGEYPAVFRSTVARTREGALTRPGGATQSLIVNRSRFTEPELVDQIPEQLRKR